jgi:hypothetical protein
MKSSSALPKKKPRAKSKYAQLPRDLRGAAKLLDEKKLIMNINKVLGRDGRVETPLPRGDDPKHVEAVLGGIARKIGRLGSRPPHVSRAQAGGIRTTDGGGVGTREIHWSATSAVRRLVVK